MSCVSIFFTCHLVLRYGNIWMISSILIFRSRFVHNRHYTLLTLRVCDDDRSILPRVKGFFFFFFLPAKEFYDGCVNGIMNYKRRIKINEFSFFTYIGVFLCLQSSAK